MKRDVWLRKQNLLPLYSNKTYALSDTCFSTKATAAVKRSGSQSYRGCAKSASVISSAFDDDCNSITCCYKTASTLTLTPTTGIAASISNSQNDTRNTGSPAAHSTRSQMHSPETAPHRSSGTGLVRPARNALVMEIQLELHNEVSPINATQTRIVADSNAIKGDVSESSFLIVLPRSQRRRRRRLSMTGKTEIAPGVYIAASCRKQWYMWNTCEGTYSPTQIADKSVFLPIVPNAMIREVNMLLTPEKQDKLSWNVDEDNMILRYYYSRGDIVLESPVPGICPHIVITLAQDTVEDYYIPFSNRVDPQWPDFLIVPPYFDVSLSRLFLHPQQSFENDISQEFPPTCTVSSQFYPSGLLPVFSATRFDKYIFETSNERNRVSSVVTVVQKLQIRVAAIAAASLAISLRDRYDDPSYLPLFEPSFCWTDPAEPIIVTTKRILGTIFIESPSPFTIPHIIINSPPPQDPYIPWMNGTNSPQDAGFGRYLTVPLRHANYINQSHQSYESSWSWDEISLEPCVSDDDLVSEADSLSLPDTPQQSTFVAEFDSYGKGDRTLRLPSITSGNYSLFDECPPISESMFELPKILDKWPRGEDEGWNSLSSDSEDSDDDLPPFDEWYQNIASRTVSPA